jgi:hypothetical protein
LDDEDALDLTVSSSRLADKNAKLKKSSEPTASHPNLNKANKEPLLITVPARPPMADGKKTPNCSNQDLIDTKAIIEPVLLKTDDRAESILQTTKETILNRVFFMQFNEVIAIEKSMMHEIIEKDTERERFLRELTVKLEILQRENQILTAENKSLKELMQIWRVSG